MKIKLIRKYTCLGLLLALTAFLSTSIFAHHSSTPHFEKGVQIDVTGSFTELKMVNPHAYIYFDVEQNGETANWRCELSSATQLRRYGWSEDTFSVGEQLRVQGNPARREDNVCYMSSITKSDGIEISRSGQIGESTVVKASVNASERPAVLPNGQPNLQGPWVTRSFGRQGTEGIRPNWEFSEAGKLAVGDYDMAFDDPILECHFVNIINAWNHDIHVNDISQSEDAITLQYGFMDLVRTIHLNMDEHPSDITPSSEGHSIGYWEGDTLVVDTTGFTAGMIEHRTGQKHSADMHIVERFRYSPEDQRLYRDYTLTDPYLENTVVAQDVMALSGEPYTPYGCVELAGKNNIRPSDERYNQIDESGVIATGEGVQVEAEVEESE